MTDTAAVHMTESANATPSVDVAKQGGQDTPADSKLPPHNTSEQPARESNLDAIVVFFESGITDTSGELGIELEHTIVHDDMSPVSYSERHGVQWILHQLKDNFPEATFDPEGDLLGVARPSEAITLEPAAQLELSAGPFAKLADAEKTYRNFESLLESILTPVGERALTLGYHPYAKAADLELIPKRRYRFMDLYLGAKGPFGPRMMRGSTSTQVSIDYSSVADCLRKLRLAFATVPLFSLMCDNSPIFEGAPRSHELVRTEIWRYCDPDRCGLVPDVMDPLFDLRRYAAYLLDVPAILAPCKKEEWCYSERTFGEIYAERTMTRTEVEHVTSMFFTDVRLKTYLEIRPADAMPIPYVLAYAALIKGLFYTPENLNVMDSMFQDVRATNIEAAKDALMENGYSAVVYGQPVAQLADELIRLAYAGLDDDEQHYMEPLAKLVAARETLASQAEHSGYIV